MCVREHHWLQMVSIYSFPSGEVHLKRLKQKGGGKGAAKMMMNMICVTNCVGDREEENSRRNMSVVYRLKSRPFADATLMSVCRPVLLFVWCYIQSCPPVRDVIFFQLLLIQGLEITPHVSQSAFLCTDVKDIVSPDECIPILVLQLAIDVLLCLFQRDIHVSVQTGQYSPVIDSGIQLHDDRPADDLLQEVWRILLTNRLIHAYVRNESRIRFRSVREWALVLTRVMSWIRGTNTLYQA